MSRWIAHLRRGLFGTAVVGALSFGATQALASPTRGDSPPTCDETCNRLCQSLGFIGGFCRGDLDCNCYL